MARDMTPTMRILVVEDSPTQAEELRLILEAEGFEAHVVPEASRALDLLRARRFDIVISDVVMPGLSGFEFCRKLRSQPDGMDVPVILLTALTDPMDIIEGLECGADNFLQKPCLPDVIVGRVRSLLDNRRIRAEGRIKVGVDVSFLGKRFTINAEKSQILDHLVSTFEDIVRTNKEVVTSGRKLNALLHIAEGLNRARSELEVMETALEGAMDLPGVQGGWIVLREGEDGFRVAATRGLPRALLRPGVFDGDCACRRALRGNEVSHTTIVIECERLAGVEGEGVAGRRHAVVPLRSDGRVLGLINFLAEEGGQFTREDLKLLDGLGSQIAVALARARMQEQLRGDLRASEERYHILMERANDAIFVLDPGGMVLEVNRQAEAMLGRPGGDIIHHAFAEFVASAELARWEDKSHELQTTGSVRVHDLRLPRADGRTLIADISAAQLQVGAERMVLAIARDITERVEAEKQFQRMQKFEAVGQLAGGVAHDFNNLLTVITGHTDLLLDRLSEEGALREGLDEIRGAADRAASLTRQLLAFSRKQIFAPEVLDLNTIVTDLEKLLGRLIGEDIDLQTIKGASFGRVLADPAQIDQVIMNLVVNARDAMPGGGRLVIETADVSLDDGYAGHHLDVRPGPYVMLSVTDTGTGMDEETQSHLFEPFFTTKEMGKGTGLGLSTVYGIVKQSGGNIWVYSEPGRGTTFKVYLPRVEDAIAVKQASRRAAKAPTGWETILLVEDEEMVRDLAARILERNGYKVLRAGHGGEALSICEQHQGPIHLVVTDVVMPKMSGGELAERLGALLPGTRVLYVSGYTSDGIVRQGLLDPGMEFLQKPFTADALARKVREILDTGPKI